MLLRVECSWVSYSTRHAASRLSHIENCYNTDRDTVACFVSSIYAVLACAIRIRNVALLEATCREAYSDRSLGHHAVLAA